VITGPAFAGTTPNESLGSFRQNDGWVRFAKTRGGRCLVSRAQRSTKWCAADPGPLRTELLAVPDQRCATRSRCIASGTCSRLGCLCYPSHDIKQPISFPRRVFYARGLQLCFAHPNRGVGGAPRDVRVRARHPWGVHMTRHARRLRGALRPMTRDARLSALHRGGFGPRGRASVSLGARRPTTAGSCLRIRAASSSQPGRSAWRATSRASRGQRLRAACRKTPLPAPPSGSSPETPLNERGCGCSYHERNT
jgi:hypothetical protein